VSTIAKNQHYVWRYYLSPWAEDDKVWCVRAPSTTAFRAKLKNIGSETYFYRVYELEADDLAYLEQLISRTTSLGLEDIHRAWVELVQRAFALKRALGDRGAGTAERARVDRALDDIAKTLGEHYHTAVENRAQPILKQLRAEDASFYADDQSAMDFILFISHQYFRTANMRNRMYQLPPMIAHDPQRTWPIENYIYAVNVGASLFLQRKLHRVVFLENKTPVKYIAGDQPVINLNSHKDEHLCLFYPLSPVLAMALTAEPARFPHDRREVGLLEAERYNFAIYSKSDSQIYSSDRDYLEELALLPKTITTD
jgi:hypothetical protein